MHLLIANLLKVQHLFSFAKFHANREYSSEPTSPSTWVNREPLKAFYFQKDVYYVKDLMIDNVYLVTSNMGASIYFLCPSQREMWHTIEDLVHDWTPLKIQNSIQVWKRGYCFQRVKLQQKMYIGCHFSLLAPCIKHAHDNKKWTIVK